MQKNTCKTCDYDAPNSDCACPANTSIAFWNWVRGDQECPHHRDKKSEDDMKKRNRV